MELLTKEGWSSAYSIETVIMQSSATLGKGKARVQFRANKSQCSLTRAQQSYQSLVQIHEKNGEAGARLEIRTFAKPEVSIRLNSKNPFQCLSLFHLLARYLSLLPREFSELEGSVRHSPPVSQWRSGHR